MMRSFKGFLPLAFGVFGVMVGRASAQDMDIRVGRTAAGQLKVGGYDFSSTLPLNPTGGILNGWSGANPGFSSLSTSDPPNDWFTLQNGAQISVRVVSLDPAFRVIGPGLQILDDPGEATFLGSSAFDRHLTWHINSDSPMFESTDCIWQGTLVVFDDGTTNYTDSAPFTVRFTNVTAAQLATDCNGNQFPDVCDLADGTSQDINDDNIPDECQCIVSNCADADVCTNDLFDSVEMMCTHDPIASLFFGDLDYSNVVDVDDIICSLAGFSGDLCCPFERIDIAPCGGNGVIDVDDILYVLDAFAGTATCPNPCPP